MDKIEFIKQIENNQESLKSSIQEIFKTVDLYRLKVEEAHSNNFINDSIYNYKLILINEMNVLIKRLKKLIKKCSFFTREIY